MKRHLCILIFCLLSIISQAQGLALGARGGLTVGFQRWNGFERSPLPSFNGSLTLEGLRGGSNYSILSELGYHVKGSRLKSFYRDPGNNLRRVLSDTKFNNISLMLGMRSAYGIGASGTKAYYLMGLRGDYNISHSFDQRITTFKDEDINKFTYGLSLGGGIEFPIASGVNMTVELQVSPDVKPQIDVPEGKYSYVNSNGALVAVPETRVLNTVLEITVGFRFIRLVEYEE